jgi:uncharacterized protein YndB with AHSA1/START domain
MKILFLSLLAILAIVMLTGLVGMFLPATRTASAVREINAPPARVWRLLTDVAGQPAWRPNLSAVDVQDATPGRERWIERPKAGPAVRFQTEYQTHLTDWVIAFSGPAEGRWTGKLELLPGDRTRIRVEESSTVKNPWARVLARVAFDPQAFIQTYLDQLSRTAETRPD